MYEKENITSQPSPILDEITWLKKIWLPGAVYGNINEKWRISSANVPKFAVSCGFSHVHWRYP